MRILQICSARSIGGGERHVIDLSNELLKRGHDVFLSVAVASPVIGKIEGIADHHISTHSFRNAIDIGTTAGIARTARENKIDLINVHLAKDYPIAAAVSLTERIPYMITRHVLFPMSRIHRWVLRDAAFVIAPSNAVAENLRREAIFDEEKIVTIRYGLDVDNFPLREAVDRRGGVVGAVGNLDPVKGFDVLIRAAKLVAAEHPAVSFQIFGEDRSRDGRYEAELRSLISELGLTDVVKLMGWSSDVRTPLRSFDIFVSSSRSESFGFVIAEAMLSGVPVIASETEGAREIISDPSLGKLVPIASPDALADAILQEFAGTFTSEAARRHIEENFSLRRMVDETEALYRRVVEKD